MYIKLLKATYKYNWRQELRWATDAQFAEWSATTLASIPAANCLYFYNHPQKFKTK